MQFIDTLRIFARGGRGGDGCLSFRREKYVEFGGPDGGNGGAGGGVFLEADPGMSTLLDLAAHPHRVAQDGKGGKGSNKTGATGSDLIVQVPCGTLVYKESRLLADLTKPGQRVLVARGGRGGRGNASFKSNANKAPRLREKGQPGEDNAIDLELKLLADVGLVGFPNAGKSTFLAAVSNARPKIADYPFTTLSPNLGLVRHRGRSFVLADIPGLIEGAHAGKGLGDEFLRHIERTKVLIHLVDPFGFQGREPAATVKAIDGELSQYSAVLRKRPRLLAVTKMDLTGAEAVWRGLARRFRRRVFAVSAVTGRGMRALLDEVVKAVARAPAVETREAAAGRKTGISIEKEGAAFAVSGEDVERFAAMTDFSLPQSARRFHGILKKMGVEKRLLSLGARPGDTVRIGGMEFEWLDESRATPPQTPARRRKSYRRPHPIAE
jgi:GTP-binding protein